MSVKNTIIIAILLIIITGGVFLRLHKIGEESLWIDEGYSIIASQAIIERGVPQLDSSRMYGGWRIPNYITAFSMKTFDFDPFNPWSARIVATIFGILTIIITFLLAQKIFSLKQKEQNNTQSKEIIIAIASAFLLSFSSWHIAWSSQIRGYTAIQFFLLLTLYFSYVIFKEKNIFSKKNIFYIICLSLSILGGYFTNPLALLVIPGIFFYYLVFFSSDFIKRNKNWYFYPSLLVGAFLLGWLFFYMSTFITKLEPHSDYRTYLYFISNDLRFLSIAALLAILLGVFDNKRLKSVIYIFLPLATSFTVVIFYHQTPHARYLFPSLPLLIILSSYTIYRLTEIFTNIISTTLIKVKEKKKDLLHILLFILSFSLFSYPYLQLTPSPERNLEIGSPQPNFKAAYTLIKDYCQENNNTLSKEACDMSDIIIISPHPHLSQIYLNTKGYWLKMSLTGRTSEIERRIVNKEECLNKGDYTEERRENYVCAPVIENEEHLIKLIEENNGFAIIDEMAKRRLLPEIPVIHNHPKTELILMLEKEKIGSLWLYQF